MTIQELYALCDNLTHLSYIELRRVSGEILDEGHYTYLHTKWSEHRIKGFMVEEDGTVVIYL